jgi:hypothetical protein
MAVLFKIVGTILIVWFFAGVIGLELYANRMRPNALVGFTALLTALFVGYLWTAGELIY